MCTIHIRIGHDNNTMIAKLLEIERLTNRCSECYDKIILDLLISKDFIDTSLFGIEDFSFKWKYCLKLTIASLLC